MDGKMMNGFRRGAVQRRADRSDRVLFGPGGRAGSNRSGGGQRDTGVRKPAAAGIESKHSTKIEQNAASGHAVARACLGSSDDRQVLALASNDGERAIRQRKVL